MSDNPCYDTVSIELRRRLRELPDPNDQIAVHIAIIDTLKQFYPLHEPGLPEIPCCPVHEKLYREGKVKSLDNCFVCIRNQRDELLEARDRTLDALEAIAREVKAPN